MTDLPKAFDDFVDAIEKRVAAIGPADYVKNGQNLNDPRHVLCLTLPLQSLSSQLQELLGQEQIAKFFNGKGPDDLPLHLHVIGFLANTIPSCCTPAPGKKLVLNRERLLQKLILLGKCVQEGQLDFTISLRLTNVDISEDFDFVDGIRFHKLSPDVIQQKYPINRQFAPIPEIFEPDWTKHCVEVIVPGRGTLAEFEELQRTENNDALVGSILHSFILSGVCKDSPPYITHVFRDSPIEQNCLLQGSGGISSSPRLLTNDDISALKSAYRFLRDAVQDSILEAAVDRFILGTKRGTHHPNKINQPNWDKVVDYVIAMESLFLTVNGASIAQELSYRFRLNGSSLLHAAIGAEKRQTFHALKHLYQLRSMVVHGGVNDAITAANKFLEYAKVDCPNHKHSLGRLMLVFALLEKTSLTDLQ